VKDNPSPANMSPISNDTNHPLAEFICPLTKAVMMEPTVSCYGTNFEKAAILKWLNEGNALCPITGKPLRPSNLVSNTKLKREIQQSWGGTTASPVEEEGDQDLVSGEFLFIVDIPPKEFFCPLTNEIMTYPVMTREGISYERDAILRWLENADTCPVTGKALCTNGIVPNNKLQKEIEEWQHVSGAAMKKMELNAADVQAWLDAKKHGKEDNNDVGETLRSFVARGVKRVSSLIKQPTAKSA
jgi:hypothetical protein